MSTTGLAGISGVPWLRDGPAAKLLAVLNSSGEEARVVGGAVRNALFGEALGDIDLATTALPADVLRRVEAAGFRAVPTGLEHGTVTVIVEGRPFEVTTLREDVETFGRKAVVRYGRDWRADAERRDFTMNALSVTADGRIHDYVGGLADIAERRVRFIGEPAARIAEDYLRILRFFRFHASYGEGPPDAAGLHAAIMAREGLQKLSRERVRMEVLKLLVARGVVPTLTVMAESGLLVLLLGGVPLLASLSALTKAEDVLEIAPCAIRRLGALTVFVREDAERLWARLRLTNVEHKRLQVMAEDWWRLTPARGDAAARALVYQLGVNGFVDRALIAWTRTSSEGSSDEAWRRFIGLPQHWVAPIFPLKAADFLTRGVPKGPRLGRALHAAEEEWIAADFPMEPAALDRIADRASAAAR